MIKKVKVKLDWQAKLTGLIVLALSAVMLVQLLYVVPYIKNQEVEHEEAHQQEISRYIAWELDYELSQSYGRLIELSERAEFRSMDIAAQQQILSTVAEVSMRFHSFFVMDADGWFVSAGGIEDFSTYTNKSYADSPYFTIPFKQGEFYYPSPNFHPALNLLSFSIALPIESDTGQRVGVLMGIRRLNHIIDMVANYPLEEGMSAYVVDTNGTVMAHSNIDLLALDKGPLSLNYSDYPLVQDIMAGGAGGTIEHMHGDTPYFGTYSVLEANGWGVVVGRPMNLVIAEANILSRQLLLINMVIFGLALLSTLIFSRQIMAGERKMAKTLENRGERIGHLNLVLGAIRNVNQLITKEKDQDKLLQGICDNLTENRGYYNAWIILLDDSRKLITYAESRLGKSFLLMVELFKQGKLTTCGQQALNQSEVVVTEDPVAICTDCSLSGSYVGRGAMTVRLEYGEKVYGLLSVSVPVALATDVEELGLFREVTSDIAFALHNMEVEEKSKQMVEELSNSEERLSQAVKGNPIPTFLINNKHVITHWNEACENLTNISSNEAIGSKKQWMALYPKERPVMADLIVNSLPEETVAKYYGEKYQKSILIKGAYEAEDFFPHLGEKGKWLFFIAAPLRDAHGKVIGAIETLQDITMRKQAEEELIGHREHLEELVEARTRELKEAQENLLRSERLATLGQFSGSISHELRNPLGVIDSSVYYLKTKLKDADEKVLEHLARIKSSVSNSTAIIESLLNLTRMTEPHLEKLNLADISSDAVSTAKVPARVKVIEDFPAQELMVNADREQLLMTFKNIIKNAAEAMDGEGILTITVRVTNDGQAELSFEDTGPGIAKENLEKVFQPLFSTRAKGIGFGLSICKMIIDKHGGTITAISEPGKGATLIIRLPPLEK